MPSNLTANLVSKASDKVRTLQSTNASSNYRCLQHTPKIRLPFTESAWMGSPMLLTTNSSSIRFGSTKSFVYEALNLFSGNVLRFIWTLFIHSHCRSFYIYHSLYDVTGSIDLPTRVQSSCYWKEIGKYCDYCATHLSLEFHNGICWTLHKQR